MNHPNILSRAGEATGNRELVKSAFSLVRSLGIKALVVTRSFLLDSCPLETKPSPDVMAQDEGDRHDLTSASIAKVELEESL